MKGPIFIGILVIMGYFLYSYYEKNTGVTEAGTMKDLTDAPAILKNKFDKAMQERTQRMKDRLNEQMSDQ
jgi:hypothetical protein